MQKIVRGKSYIFEGDLPHEITTLLEKWGRLIKRGEIVIYTIDTGEIKSKRLSETPTSVLRRIYIQQRCGCLLEIDEDKNFETNTVTYRIFKKRLCGEHQA
ncbi:MAG: hypothetical protein QXT46_04835 [Pyrobaculum sp.]